ncbi:MAG: universal stress protein, partial [Gemmataceae bacterium]|nr:universal stress protein [Gemmataceae bacterium]
GEAPAEPRLRRGSAGASPSPLTPTKIDLHRILVPTDFSKHSQTALKYAVALAEKFGAEIHLLHVVQDFAVFLPDAVTAGPPVLPPVDQLTAAVRDALARVIRENKLEPLPIHSEAREGTPYHEIIAFAQEKDIDLIIMGTHGRGGLAHLLLGSVTEKVVRKAPCPVLTVRDPEHEFVRE